MTEKSSEGRMRSLVIAVGGPLRAEENRKSWLARVARQAGITVRAAKQAFYEEIRDPEHKIVFKLREAAGREQTRQLARQFADAAEALAYRDPDRHRHNVDVLIRAARLLSGMVEPPGDMDSPGTQK